MRADRSASADAAWRAAIVGIVVLTPIAYWPSLSGGFLIDDDILLTDSALIRAADGVWRFWWSAEAIDYWPVSNTSLWLEWRLWGGQALGYRITNLLLHVVEALLFWRILSRLAIPGAAVAALLFALHPVNVETVAWISQRKTLLALLFAQLSALAYLKAEGPSAPRAGLWYAASLTCFAAALLSKVSVAIFPLLLVLMIAWTRRLVRRDAARLAPFFLTAAALVGVNIWFRARDPNIEVQIDIVGAALRAGCAVWFYLSKALLPVDLAFMYEPWRIEAAQVRWWLPLGAAVLATLLLWRWRDTWSRPLLFAWLYYCLALLPAMGLTETPYIEDHYQHPALIAVTAVVAAAWQRWRERIDSPRLANAVMLGVVAALTLLTWRHAANFTDNVTLMRAATVTDPQSATAHRNLAFALLHAGDAPAAQRAGEDAVALDPGGVEARKVLAAALAALGDRAAAIEQLRVALQLGASDPETLGNLGAFLRESGRPREALSHLEEAVRRSPRSFRLRCNLGKTLLELGETDEAMRHFEEALRIDPTAEEARQLLAAAREQRPATAN